MQAEFAEIVKRKKLWAPRETLIVSFSGGPDSLALTDLMLSLPENLKPAIHLAHLNHKLRGLESDADADFVRQIAGDLGVPITVGSVNPRVLAQRLHLSLEDAARRLRYRFLFGVAASVKAEKLVLGHHLDDQAETVLLHLFRGSGLDGLAGMKYVTPMGNLKVVRPLLNFRHSQLKRYCYWRGYIPRTDASNYSVKYVRNRIRNRLIPLLEKEYNPKIIDALGRTAQIIQTERDYLEEVTNKNWREALAALSPDRVELSSPDLIKLHPAARACLWRRALAELTGGAPINLKQLHIKFLERLLFMQPGKFCSLPGNITAVKERESIIFFSDIETHALPYLRKLIIPGETLIEEDGTFIEAAVFDRNEIGALDRGRNVALLDFENFSLPINVRNRLAGDYFRPLGMNGRGMKLKHFLNSRKVAVYKRDTLPLVVSGEEIAWVAGVEISDKFKINIGTEKVLMLEIKKI